MITVWFMFFLLFVIHFIQYWWSSRLEEQQRITILALTEVILQLKRQGLITYVQNDEQGIAENLPRV